MLRNVDKNIEREYPSFVNKIENHWTYIPFIIISWSLNTSKNLIFNKTKNSKRKHITFRMKEIYLNKTIIIINKHHKILTLSM
jgi:hypothetical protein